MSFVNVSASFVQKDCLAIIKWWERKKCAISERYLRFRTHLLAERGRQLDRMNFLYRWGTYFFYRPKDTFWNKHHRDMQLVKQNTYVDTAHRLLAACERVLGENNRLKDPVISLSTEDAEWLKNIMPQTKEKL